MTNERLISSIESIQRKLKKKVEYYDVYGTQDMNLLDSFFQELLKNLKESDMVGALFAASWLNHNFNIIETLDAYRIVKNEMKRRLRCLEKLKNIIVVQKLENCYDPRNKLEKIDMYVIKETTISEKEYKLLRGVLM